MSLWFLPQILSDETRQNAFAREELALPAEGLPDLSRAQGMDQVSEWLRQLHPEATPEGLAEMTQHFWRLGHELLPEDTIVCRARAGSVYLIGEIAGVYSSETRGQEKFHVWPVRWRDAVVGSDALPTLKGYAACPGLVEIADEDALQALKPYVPTLNKGNASLFRWVAIGTLFFELIYFWPRGQK